MAITVPNRFEPIRFFRRDRQSLTFLATDHRLGRNEVLVKIFARTKGALDSDTIKTLLWYQGLRHPLISEVLDAGRSRSGDLYYVRPHYSGSEFFSATSIELVKSLLSAVDFLHSTGRVHGSIKPSNVFTAGNQVRLSDPWLSATTNQKSQTEQDVRFTAPEVLAGGPLTPESDLYSVGAMLYRFFSGRDPFEDSDIESLKAKHIWASPRPLTSVCHVSQEIGDMVGSLLRRDPNHRKAAFEALITHVRVRRVSASRAPAVGIDRQMHEAAQWICHKHGLRIVHVEAPVGLGKSRFAAELRDRLSMLDKPIFICEINGQKLNKTLVDGIAAIANESSPQSSISIRLRDWLATFERHRSRDNDYREVIKLSGAFAPQSRFLVFVDDFDRANRAVSRLVGMLMSQPDHVDVGILLTTRSLGLPKEIVQILDLPDPSKVQKLKLDPLSSNDSETLISFLTDDLSRRTLARGRSAGNPFFLEEFSLRPFDDPVGAIRSVLAKTISLLPGPARNLAEVLSIFRSTVNWDVLVGVTGLPDVEVREEIQLLRRSGLVDSNSLVMLYPDASRLLNEGITRARRVDIHARAYRFLRDYGYPRPLLAEHAFQATLYEVAATIFRELASEKFADKDRAVSATYFARALECRRHCDAVEPLSDSDTVKYALSLTFVGKQSAAKRILQQLLEKKSVYMDAEVLSSAYSASASHLIQNLSDERIRLLNLAIECLPKNSPSLIYRYRALAGAYLVAGDTANMEQTLKEAESCCTTPEQIQQLGDLQGALLMNKGDFRAAAAYYQAQKFLWAGPGAISNNLALCIEHLGDINRARELQISALREAEAGGLLLLQIGSLMNLGGMETKLGNLSKAQENFDLAFIKVNEALKADAGPNFSKSGISYADAALHFIAKGEYHRALPCTYEADSGAKGHHPLDKHFTTLVQGTLYALLGDQKSALKSLEDSRRIPIHGEFFEIERLICESRIVHLGQALSDRLSQAVLISRKLGTLYQECQLLLALARVFLKLNDIPQANRAARRARRLAVIHKYRLLELEALLLIGVSSKSHIQKEFFLTRAFKESTELSVAPLASECAFEIGSLRQSLGDSAGAIEYLSKSISITTSLAQNLIGPLRKSYLDQAAYRAARHKLRTASEILVTRPAKTLQALALQESMFGKLYRLLAAMTAASDARTATTCLLQTLKQSMEHTLIVAFKASDKIAFHSLRNNISEQAKQFIADRFALPGDKVYITGIGSPLKKTAVWLPLFSLAQLGGIYVECRRPQIPLDEEQLQFLTIAANIAGSAFDRFCVKPTAPASIAGVLHGLIGTSKQITAIHEQIEIAATNDANVLVEGESGTGKELVARAIHSQSRRAQAPFVPVDCGALPTDLIEAELFGAKKGAYTGAFADRTGLFEAAHHGTIFLDEISNLGLAAQAKLLRVLQDREVRRIGSTSGRSVDVRLIAASNCNLEELVRQGKFRRDLLYRLKVLYVFIAPLRNRRQDIPLLATTFLERLNIMNQTRKYFGPNVISKLVAGDYAGNVRELQNVVERAFYSTRSAVITQVETFEPAVAPSYEAESWFRELTEGKQDFWRAVHDAYKRRDLPRERVIALVDYGLRTTHGNYRAMAGKFQIPKGEYRRFMDFLRRSKCLLDFRPYRKIDEI